MILYPLTHWITLSTVLGKSSFEREVPYPVRRLKTDLKSGYFGENKTDLENVPQSRCFYSYHRTNPAVYLNNKIIKFYTKFHLRYQNPSQYHKIIMKSVGTLTNSNRATKSHSIWVPISIETYFSSISILNDSPTAFIIENTFHVFWLQWGIGLK